MTRRIAAPATSLDSPGGGEYWDPVSNTYRSKMTNDRVPDEIIQEENTSAGYETDSSMETDSTLSTDSDLWEYWDPVTDSYKSKKSSKNTPDKSEPGEVQESGLDSSLEENRDPAVEYWEYWDPITISSTFLTILCLRELVVRGN